MSHLRCASANPIIEQTTTVKTTDSAEMMKLLRYHHPMGLSCRVLL